MKNIKFATLTTILVTLLTAHLAQADNVIDETLKCVGTEPFWGMTLEVSSWQDGANSSVERVVNTLKFSGYDSNSQSSFDAHQLKLQTSRNDQSVYSVTADGETTAQDLTAIVDFHLQQEGSCSDGMSDLAYPYSIFVHVNEQTLSGCCQSNIYPAK